jgi:hypothetical protein
MIVGRKLQKNKKLAALCKLTLEIDALTVLAGDRYN